MKLGNEVRNLSGGAAIGVAREVSLELHHEVMAHSTYRIEILPARSGLLFKNANA